MAVIKQYEKKDGSKAWLFQVYLGIDESTGREVRTTRRGFKTQAAAKREMNRLVVDYEENGLNQIKRKSFEQVYLEWLEQYQKTVKESTVYSTKKLFKNHALPSFHGTTVDRVSVAYCQREVNKWHSKIVMYDVLITYVSNVFEFAIKHGYAEVNPMKKIIKPKKIRKVEDNVLGNEEIDYYDKEELQQFLELTKAMQNPRYYPLFRLLSFSGMRIGEALSLLWSDIDFNNNTIRITKTVANDSNGKLIIGTPKTYASTREIEIDGITLDVLLQWKEKQIELFKYDHMHLQVDDKQLLFPNNENKPTTTATIWYAMNKLQQDNDLKIIPTHGLRHTHCSLLFEAGATIKEVQSRLGHTDIKTTMDIYAHVTKSQKKETVSKFVNLVDF